MEGTTHSVVIPYCCRVEGVRPKDDEADKGGLSLTALAIKTETRLARPLKELVPLIRQDIEAGKDAERKAGLPYYKAAGEKLREAKDQLPHGEFIPWVQRNFDITDRHARRWMEYAKTDTHVRFENPPTSLNDFFRQKTGNDNYNRRPLKQDWHDPIKSELAGVDADFLENQQQKELAERQKRQMAEADRIKAERAERDRERELALKLVDIGFKALATKLHPDKPGGSNEAMHRLTRIKKRLQSLC